MQATHASPSAVHGVDERVYLHGVSWEDYERLLAMRGERSRPRITYLEGEVELMSPSKDHERITSMIGRLVEAYADERGLDLYAHGSWTVKDEEVERGAEADKCYVLGGPYPPVRPDLAIEVVWTSGGLDKLEVWRGLRVREVWFWDDGRISVHVLEAAGYVARPTSLLFPELDLARVASPAPRVDQPTALREFRASLRG